ncbi:sodium-dependent transporter [Streptomyces filamentosus]|uniref:Sodium-dependent transporter n=1 Tax=Streptomyces filamentosus TaxID=67294 RepID=A0ABY4UTS6_STRFL|nr:MULTISPECIES: sodium-dependent transporter [Streptomyces]ESU48279.1 sodium-dependent transporter [Streptomyces sp. HCCB10043]EWS94023.1 sodium-dependent transporter [Streptomyces filamentosus NRRL 11379]MYR81026.1 sodium-dependent transporter [Streptomyces sp. SID5466]USC47484.1 sodium-dependent transporter [Streptomyces filamentosus]
MTEQPREQWATRAGFLLAAIGSAVGLGNIWRFPAIAYDNGGGAFLLPYLIALLTAGIPLLIMEYTIGRKYRLSPPAALRRMARPAEAIGWWQVAISFVIATYYAVIIAWAVRYVGFSVGQQWGDDPEAFLFGDFLRAPDTPGFLDGFVPGVFWPLVFVWVVVLGILAFGIRRGIERANKIFIPLLFVLFAALVIRALTLDGAATGLDALFTPDWSELGNGTVWVAAYGQIFFSLSIGFGIMVTYASYLGRRADLTGSAMVAGFANSSFEILAGIGVFATLGYLATASGVGVDEVAGAGIGLAFVAFPAVISEMPFGGFFGILFFSSLVIAGLSSLISIVQVVVSAVQDRTGMRRRTAVLGVGGLVALVSLVLFPTESGIYLLDASDHFINQYGIALAALIGLIVIVWVLRQLPSLQANADATSAVRLGHWWRICLGVITPVVLGWMMVDSLRTEFQENYEGYSTGFLLSAGWSVAIGALLVGVILSLMPWPAGGEDIDLDMESPADRKDR